MAPLIANRDVEAFGGADVILTQRQGPAVVPGQGRV